MGIVDNGLDVDSCSKISKRRILKAMSKDQFFDFVQSTYIREEREIAQYSFSYIYIYIYSVRLIRLNNNQKANDFSCASPRMFYGITLKIHD